MTAPVAGLRVLIVAEHASRRFGGEAILPYHYFRLLRARGVDAFLLVHERTRSELETLFPHDLPRLRFVKDMTLQKLFYRAGKLLPRRISEATFGLANQFLTQWSQRAMVRGLATAGTVVHQPIPVSPRFPSLLWNLGAPLIVGPLNGGMDYPHAFAKTESAASRVFVAFGRALSDIANRLLPGKRKAALVLVANERTRAALPTGLEGEVVVVPENGVDLAEWTAPERTAAGTTVHPNAATFLFMGRLVDWKALDIVLEALAAEPRAQLTVIGDGAMLEQWKALTANLGLADRVEFLGWLSQAECARHLHGCVALVLPSIYECGGAVVLEAMAMSKPVIATRWGGPADYLDTTCGILVDPTSRTAMVHSFAGAMQRLLDSPADAAAMGTAGRERVLEHFNWQQKIDVLLGLYERALAGRRAYPLAVPAPVKQAVN